MVSKQGHCGNHIHKEREATKPPFDKPLSFTRLFDKKMQMEIMAAINKVKDNAVVIAS